MRFNPDGCGSHLIGTFAAAFLTSILMRTREAASGDRRRDSP
jgi:hypothetical protein